MTFCADQESNWRSAIATATYEELERWSIRTGCETSLNRQADFELRRRGYVFNPALCRWQPFVSPCCASDCFIDGKKRTCKACGASGYENS